MDDLWHIWDVFLRGAAVCSFAISAILFNRRPVNRRKSLSVVSVCIALIAYLLVSTPSFGLSGVVEMVLVAIAGTAPVLVYWASAELFHDEPAFAVWQYVVGALIFFGAWTSSWIPFADLVRGSLVIALFCHLLYVLILSAEDDLIESRRKFRRWFLATIVVLVISITIIEVLGRDDDLHPAFTLLHATAFMLLAATFLVWASELSSNIWFRGENAQLQRLHHSPAELALSERIKDTLDGEFWREEGMTIGELSQRLSAKEHRVRRAINKVLGYKNFSTFINAYRIEEAKRILADPAQAETAILSIAYDTGFSSLGPFNRAFRQVTGMTPTAYRTEAIGETLRGKARQ